MLNSKPKLTVIYKIICMSIKLFYILFLLNTCLPVKAQHNSVIELIKNDSEQVAPHKDSCLELLNEHSGNGVINFFDIFPNTPTSSANLQGNILSVRTLKTTLGNIKTVEIIFVKPMPDSNYNINLSGFTKGIKTNQIIDYDFPAENSVKYYTTNKSKNSFVITAEEIYPATQDSKVEFNFNLTNKENHEKAPFYSTLFINNSRML